MAPDLGAARGGIGDKIRAAMAVGKTRWGMLALVFFATTLNYIDRAALGVMQPILAKEMSWTAMDYANILVRRIVFNFIPLRPSPGAHCSRHCRV